MKTSSLVKAVLAAASAIMLAACASERPEPIKFENTESVNAEVTSINVETRMMGLRAPSGEEFTVYVDPAVRNLAQVKAGDMVVAKYYEAMGVRLKSRGDDSGSTSAPVVTLDTKRAAAGEKPQAVLRAENTQTVRIDSVDKKNNIVTFYGSDGLVRSFPVQTEEGKEFLHKLKKGDEVEITFEEALAVGVEPAK